MWRTLRFRSPGTSALPRHRVVLASERRRLRGSMNAGSGMLPYRWHAHRSGREPMRPRCRIGPPDRLGAGRAPPRAASSRDVVAVTGWSLTELTIGLVSGELYQRARLAALQFHRLRHLHPSTLRGTATRSSAGRVAPAEPPRYGSTAAQSRTATALVGRLSSQYPRATARCAVSRSCPGSFVPVPRGGPGCNREHLPSAS